MLCLCTDRPFSTSLLADDDADASILFLSSTADMAGSVAYAAPSAVIVPAAVDTTLNANPITVSAAKVRDGSTNPALVTLGAEATLPPHVRPYAMPYGPSAPVSRMFQTARSTSCIDGGDMLRSLRCHRLFSLPLLYLHLRWHYDPAQWPLHSQVPQRTI